jgi:hypothetical protein
MFLLLKVITLTAYQYTTLTITPPDNPIAQNLLVKQLERHHLNVTATGNGEEAISGVFSFFSENTFLTGKLDNIEWEAHEPGYFSVALFDHRE